MLQLLANKQTDGINENYFTKFKMYHKPYYTLKCMEKGSIEKLGLCTPP